MMVIFTLLGMLAAGFIVICAYLFVTYERRVRRLIQQHSVERYGDIGRIVMLGAIAKNYSDWSEFIIRLRSDGLVVREAAIVGAAWIRDRIPSCESQEKMQRVANDITMFLREDYQKRLSRTHGHEDSMNAAYIKLDSIMRREGIAVLG